jgi:branched-chain amino acid transport system permease protein
VTTIGIARAATALAAVAVVALLPALISDYRALEFGYVGIYFVAMLGLNILTGFTGQISLGHGAFMGIGGYTTAILAANHGVS